MNPSLDALITAAVQLAGGDQQQHRGRLWTMDGGRACPLGWDGCSQPVFIDLAADEYDYGDPGGPGWESCERTCSHGMQRPEED